MNTNSKIELNVDIPLNAKDLAILAADSFHAELIDKQVFRSCINCINYTKEKNHCAHWNSNPPPHVIVFSCKSSAWEGDIPF